MKKINETKKSQLSDEERLILHHYLMLRWARKFIILRKGYQYFIKNKVWILSLLFVLSILKSCIWYACFGINILDYSSLQDIFMSYTNYFMSTIGICILTIFFYMFYPNNDIDNRYKKIVVIALSIIIFILIFWIASSLFGMIFSLHEMIIIFSLFYLIHNDKIAILHYSCLLLLLLSLFQPMIQYIYVKEGYRGYYNRKEVNYNFKEQSACYNYFSFDYNNIHVETNTKRYYLIGSNSNYYYILDGDKQETLIIPKKECQNIKSQLFSFNSLVFLRK